MKNKEIFEAVAKELSLEANEVKEAYYYFWEFIKQTIAAMSFENKTKEELQSMKANFNIPNLGKLYCKDKKGRV